jgi:tetratricopeptide (TPR) repeat protein
MSKPDRIAHAKTLFAERRYEETVRVCKQVLLVEPTNDDVRTLLGMALLSMQRFEEARSHMRDLVRAGRATGQALRVLAEAQLRIGEVRASIKTLGQALEIDPQDSAITELLTEAKRMQTTAATQKAASTMEEVREETFADFGPEATRVDPPLLGSDEVSIHTMHDRTPDNDTADILGPSDLPIETSDDSSETFVRDVEDDVTIARDPEDIGTTARPIFSADAELSAAMTPTTSREPRTWVQALPRAKGALDDAAWLQPEPGSPRWRTALADAQKHFALPWRSSLAWSLGLLGALLVLSVVSAIFAVRAHLSDRALSRVMQAVQVAADNGLQSSLDHAIHLAKARERPDDRLKALHARLLAISQLEHGVNHSDGIQKLLGSLSGPGRSLIDARIAYAYIYLERGEVVAARSIISATSTTKDDEQAAEAARARSLTAQASGDSTRAEIDARAAAIQRNYAPRHVALAALLRAQNGDPKGALADLARSRDAARSPLSRVARALIMLAYGQDTARAEAEAEEVLQALGSIASPPQKAWAYLIKAQVALRTGRSRLARKFAQVAAATGPMWQDEFGMTLCETLVRAGAGEVADDVLRKLPTISTDPQRRARIQAETALALKNLTTAQGALQTAGDTPRARLLRARLHELRGELQEARRLYDNATLESTLSTEAFSGLARIELNEGQPRKSIAHLQEALRRSPGNLDLIAQLTHAQLRAELLDEASQTLSRGSTFFPNEPELLSVQAWIDLAKGDLQSALSQAQAALQRDPQDADLILALGKIAQAIGNCTVARDAYEDVLAQSPRHREALLGLAQAEARCGNIQNAQAVLNRIEPLVSDTQEVDEVRAQLFVLTGAGETGAVELEKVSNKSATLWAILGSLWFQAEAYEKAQTAFTQALKMQEDLPQAILGLAWIHLQRGGLAQARTTSQKADDLIADSSVAWIKAAVIATRARVGFESGDFSRAFEWAKQAIEIDPSCSTAHHVLALLAQQRRADPIPHLRQAARGSQPMPEVFATLAGLLPASVESCQLAQRYLSAAPNGFDAARMQKIAHGCAGR